MHWLDRLINNSNLCRFEGSLCHFYGPPMSSKVLAINQFLLSFVSALHNWKIILCLTPGSSISEYNFDSLGENGKSSIFIVSIAHPHELLNLVAFLSETKAAEGNCSFVLVIDSLDYIWKQIIGLTTSLRESNWYLLCLLQQLRLLCDDSSFQNTVTIVLSQSTRDGYTSAHGPFPVELGFWLKSVDWAFCVHPTETKICDSQIQVTAVKVGA